MTKRRVVVTGLGIISPVGNELKTAWENAVNGKSGVRLIDFFDTSQLSTKFAGLVTDFNVADYMSLKEARKCDMFIQYAMASGIQAVRDAGLENNAALNLDKVGVIIGSGIGGLSTIENTYDIYLNSGPKRISPFYIPASIINMAAGHLSILYGFKGPNLAVATACTTGTHAIGLAARMIVYGDADVMVAGGSEYATTPTGVAGFAAARALSSFNEAPERASRPWDKNRDGFVLGNGSGMLILEEYEHAKRRGAPIYAELAGFGMSADAFHMTRPPEGGIGAAAAMARALEDARIDPSSVDYINAHATSTPVGDLEESLAIKAVFGSHSKKVAISSTKSMTGHLLGAAGAVEAVFTVMAIKDQVAPPTINLDEPEEGCDLDYVPHTARKMPIKAAVSNSFGFGGTNGTLVFKEITS